MQPREVAVFAAIYNHSQAAGIHHIIMKKTALLILCTMLVLHVESHSAEAEFALFAIHPNSQAFELEESDELDQAIQGYRKIKRPDGQVIYVSDETQFRISAVKKVRLAIVASGSRSVVIEFTDDQVDALRAVRLNRITGQFALLHKRQEVIGIINTVAIGVDTRRFSMPVTDVAQAERIIQSFQPLIDRRQAKDP